VYQSVHRNQGRERNACNEQSLAVAVNFS